MLSELSSPLLPWSSFVLYVGGGIGEGVLEAAGCGYGHMAGGAVLGGRALPMFCFQVGR